MRLRISNVHQLFLMLYSRARVIFILKIRVSYIPLRSNFEAQFKFIYLIKMPTLKFGALSLNHIRDKHLLCLVLLEKLDYLLYLNLKQANLHYRASFLK
jgi:hypothetical protein